MTRIKGYDQWKTASPYDNEPDPPEDEGITPSIQAILDHLHGGDDLYLFYKSIYKYTPCGPSVGFRINGEWKYCSDLPREVGENDVVDGVHVSSIVEGVDYGVEGANLFEPFPAEHFWELVDSVDRQAQVIWDDTHGCEGCGPENEMGYITINPKCKTCGGSGTVI